LALYDDRTILKDSRLWRAFSYTWFCGILSMHEETVTVPLNHDEA